MVMDVATVHKTARRYGQMPVRHREDASVALEQKTDSTAHLR